MQFFNFTKLQNNTKSLMNMLQTDIIVSLYRPNKMRYYVGTMVNQKVV